MEFELGQIPAYWWLLGTAVLLGLAGAIWRYIDLNREDAERAKVLESVAAGKSWAYSLKDPAARKDLGLGWGWSYRWERNFMRSRDGDADFLVYDQYIEHKNSPRTRRTFAAFRMRPEFPRFRIMPNTPLMMLARDLWWSKVEFPEDPPFGETYFVESPDKDLARTAFDQRVRSRILQAPGWMIESEKGWLRLTDGTTDGEPEAVVPFQAQAWEIAKLFRDR